MGMVESFGKPADACRLGIACTLTWAFWLNGASGAPTDQPLWQLSYVVLSAMMAVLGVCALKRPHAMDAGRLGSAGAGMGVLGTIALVASLNMPNAGSLQVPAYLACGCALGLLYLQWGPFYAQVSTKQMVGYLFAANIAASLLKCVVHFVPDPLSFVLAAALPVVSAIACFRTQKTMPERLRRPLAFPTAALLDYGKRSWRWLCSASWRLSCSAMRWATKASSRPRTLLRRAHSRWWCRRWSWST